VVGLFLTPIMVIIGHQLSDDMPPIQAYAIGYGAAVLVGLALVVWATRGLTMRRAALIAAMPILAPIMVVIQVVLLPVNLVQAMLSGGQRGVPEDFDDGDDY
jgi:hypothetical protein